MFNASHVLAAALVATATLLVPTHVASTDSHRPHCIGQSSPVAVHAAFLEAAEKNDWHMAFSFIDEESRATFFEKTITAMIVAWALDNNAKRQTEFSSLLRANGFRFDDSGRLLDGEKPLNTIIKDWPKLMQDIAPFLQRWHGRAFKRDDSELVNVRISGLNATATVKTKQGSTKRAQFIKHQTGWCLVRSRAAEQP